MSFNDIIDRHGVNTHRSDNNAKKLWGSEGDSDEVLLQNEMNALAMALYIVIHSLEESCNEIFLLCGDNNIRGANNLHELSVHTESATANFGHLRQLSQELCIFRNKVSSIVGVSSTLHEQIDEQIDHVEGCIGRFATARVMAAKEASILKPTELSLPDHVTFNNKSNIVEHDDGLGEQHSESDRLYSKSIDDTNAVIDDRREDASMRKLEKDIIELHNVFHQLAQHVKADAKNVQAISDSVEYADLNVHSGVTELGKAAKLQAFAYPMLGALVGGVIGGPVGVLGGLKAASLATAALGVGMGAGAGYGMKKVRDKKINEALDKTHKAQ